MTTNGFCVKELQIKVKLLHKAKRTFVEYHVKYIFEGADFRRQSSVIEVMNHC